MDFHLFFVTFITIFIAELGDKTQFAAMAASAKTTALKEVWLGVVLALAISGSLGVLAGQLLSHYISPAIMRKISGLLFMGMGVYTFFGK